MNRWCLTQGGRCDRASSLAGMRLLSVLIVAGAVGGLTDRTLGDESKFGPNRMPNRSFESLYDHWRVRIGATNDGPVVASIVEIDTSTAHTGVHSVKFYGNIDTTKWYAVESDPIPIRPGKRYKFSVWSKTEDVIQENEQYHNCNAYIQFRDDRGKIVPLGISPLRRTQASQGTHEWYESFTLVVAPEGATQVRVGVTLTCSGTAWFDDVGLYESTAPAWAKRPSGGMVYFYTQGDVPSEDTLKAGSDYLRRLEKVLGIQHSSPIYYYKYRSMEQKTEYSGKAGESHVDEIAIHSVKWDEREDVVHMLMREVGRSTLFLAEGIAAFATAVVDGRDPHAAARELVKTRAVIPMNNFLDPTVLTIAPRHVKQAEFGSFVGYLVERYGMAKFKEFFAYPGEEDVNGQVAPRYESVYGATFDEGQRDWLLFLQSGQKKPDAVRDQE